MGGTSLQKRAICYVGLCTPRPHILSFYEERMQRRIKEEVSSLKSPPGGSFPHSHFVTFPLVYHKTSSKKGGKRDRVGGTNPQKRAICYVGLCTPHPHILSFYEERMQRRIKEEVSSLKSPPGGSIPHSGLKTTFPLRLSQNFRQERGGA